MSIQRILILSFFLGSFFSCSYSNLIDDTVYKTSFEQNLNDYFNALTKLKKFNGVVYAVKNDGTVFKKAYNIKKHNRHSLYVSQDHQFDIHSISKLIAKAIIIDMEQDGLLNRSDAISKFISGIPKGEEITIQQLMDNRSGLPRELQGVENTLEMSPEQYINAVKTQALEFEPGTAKRYSNVGYELLYYLIGELNNTSFTAFLENNYFPSLKMKNAGGHFYTSKSNLKKWAQNHSQDGKIRQVKNITSEDRKQSMLYANAEDLMLFLNHCKQEPYASSIANKRGVIAWTGGSEGVATHAQIDLNTGHKFVMLANFDQIPLEDILKNMEKISNGEDIELPKAINRKEIELDLMTLEKYQGTYDIVEADHMLLEFKLEKGQLVLYQNGNKLTKLYAESENVFYYDSKSDESFEFVPAENEYSLLMDWKGIQLKGEKVK